MTMRNPKSPFSTHAGDPKRLATLVGISDTAEDAWSRKDLAAIWKHQLHAPLNFDLATVSPNVEETLTGATRADSQPLSTFADLLRHTRPPIELLQWTKSFAKTQMSEGALPPQVAGAMYYAS